MELVFLRRNNPFENVHLELYQRSMVIVRAKDFIRKTGMLGTVNVFLFIFSFALIGLLFAWQGRAEINLSGDGFYWYGVQRVLEGDLPVLDFMSYDIGRYYWSAFFILMTGNDGLVVVRASIVFMQALALFTALSLIAHAKIETVKSPSPRADYVFWMIAAVILVVWMFPEHKIIDICMSIFLLATLTFFATKPDLRGFFITGFILGLVAMFGRNHGLYGALAAVLITFLLTYSKDLETSFFKGAGAAVVGVILGYSPVLLLMLFAPGFADAFYLHVFGYLLEQKTTSIPIPLTPPWPWDVNFGKLSFYQSGRQFIIGLGFVLVRVFGPLAVLWVIIRTVKNQPVPPVYIAVACFSLTYSHLVFAYPDTSHLAQGIFPALIGCLIIINQTRANIRWPAIFVLAIASVWAMVFALKGWKCQKAECEMDYVAGSGFTVSPNGHRNVQLIEELTEQYLSEGGTFLTFSHWPGAYAVAEKKSPVWEIFALVPRSETFEKAEIERIKAADIRFVLLIDVATAGRDELRFRNTHPVTYQYIMDNYEPLPERSRGRITVLLPKEKQK